MPLSDNAAKLLNAIIFIAMFALLVLLLTGCAGIGQSNMSAEQITAAGKDKNVSAICSTATGMWGSVKTVYVNVDKSVIKTGDVGVDDSCTVSFHNTKTPKNKPDEATIQ